jgi:hypothetical protein
MVDETLKPALRLALRLHEIGDASPYQLSFAGKGNSGASFGFMQGDMEAGQPEVRQTFHDALAAAGMDDATIAGFAAQLSVHLVACPLANADRDAINAALLASSALVDAMDEQILGKVYTDLDDCTARAATQNRTIAPKALIYMALWVNMTGFPDMLLTWLGGGVPPLPRPVPPAGAVADGPAMETYLAATDYFIKNPQNMPHMMQCAAAGAVTLTA